MQNLATLIAPGLAALLLALTACGDGGQPAATPTPSPTAEVQAPAATQTPPAPEPTPTPEVTAPAQYGLGVYFNRSVVEDDVSEVEALVLTYDADPEQLGLLESWPPIGIYVLEADAPDFCRTVEAQLEAKSYVDYVSCGLLLSGSPVGCGPYISIGLNVFLTFEGERYRAVACLSLIPETELEEIGVATEVDFDIIDYIEREGEAKVYRRQGNATAIYTFSPPTVAVPAFWIKWEPE